MEAASVLAPPRPTPGPTSSDDELVALVRAGDDRAFEELYARYGRRITAFVFGMVKDHGRAEDVTQEVFLRAHRRMRDTDRDINLKPWLYEIARNACIDAHRRAKAGADVVSLDDAGDRDDDAHGRVAGDAPGTVERFEGDQRLATLTASLEGLTDTHRELLVLREFEGRSYAEIGERLGMSRPSVESTLFRARKRLAEEYDELVSGDRCTRTREAVVALRADEDALNARERKRLCMHVSHCLPCRRAATVAGLHDLLTARPPLRAKIAAVLPLPVAARSWVAGGDDALQAAGGAAPGGAWAQHVAPLADASQAGWAKAVAAAAAVVVAGGGTAVVVESVRGGDDVPRTAEVAATPVQDVAGSGRTAAPAMGAAGARTPLAPRREPRGRSAGESTTSSALRPSGGRGATPAPTPSSASAPAAPAPGSGTTASDAGPGGASSGGDQAPTSTGSGVVGDATGTANARARDGRTTAAGAVRDTGRAAAEAVRGVGDTASRVGGATGVPAVSGATDAVQDVTDSTAGVVEGTTNAVGGVLGGS